MNTEKTNFLVNSGQSVPSRRPLEVALDELAGVVDRANNSLDQLFDRLDPLIFRGPTAEGKPIIPAPTERSAVVSHISSQVIKIEKLVSRIDELYRSLDV